MERLLLISNANARSVTPYKREVIARALSAEFAVEIANTKAPGHATELARQAALEGLDLVVAMGGDGTVNEVANGLAMSRTPMAVLPAGGVNVFARSLGLPEDAVEATGLLLQRLDIPPRPIAVGQVDDRFFVQSCGVGFDGEIVRRVERRQRLKRSVGDWYYVWTGLRVFSVGYGRRRRITLTWTDGDGEHNERVHLAIAQKADPYTYLGGRAMRLCPKAERDGGVDCMALKTMRARTVFRVVISSFGRARHSRFSKVVYLHDRPSFLIECDRAMSVQADGEYVGEREAAIVRTVPDALLICC